jgi:hypothetical protein
MIILEKRDREGKLLGRCGTRCYNSNMSDLPCICKGRNRGKGEEGAKKEVLDFFLKNLEDEEGIFIVPEKIRQESFSFLEWILPRARHGEGSRSLE